MGIMGMDNSDPFVGRIYKLTSNLTDKVYVGSTINDIKKRFYDHKAGYHHYLKTNCKYTTSFEILKYDDAKITLLHEQEFECIADMHRMEGQYMQCVDNCINKHIMGRTRNQWRSDNKEKIVTWHKDYREKNKEHLLEKHTCDVCGGKYATKHISTHCKTKRHIKALEMKNEDN
jgi:hypothetical protein